MQEVREKVRNLNESSDSEVDGVPERFKPPEWLTETQPKRAPYFPQMGDELMYFMKGHESYVRAVTNRDIYPVDSKTLPWNKPDCTVNVSVLFSLLKYYLLSCLFY